ncbi:hypothetical protein, partial [Nodularia spumigena]|uniref:hypothetical protein n=1 Tax=Nodularia spumigena TaxID=70799 RepID=UPI001F2E78EE
GCGVWGVGVTSPEQCCLPYTLTPTPNTLFLTFALCISRSGILSVSLSQRGAYAKLKYICITEVMQLAQGDG